MTVPRPHTGPKAAKDRDWNWSEEQTDQVDALLRKDGWKAMKQAHAWYDDADGDPPEKKTAYKLPHHEVVNGEIKVVWRGVTAAMNVVKGGRGGVDIPAGDAKAVYEHLAKHYEQFDEEPPDPPRR
jgi:hypothetical protein